MKIEVYSNPSSVCNVSDHFTRNWIGTDTLHPDANKVKREVFSDSDKDEINLVKDGEVILSLKGSEALRLDLLQEFILNN